MGWWCDGVFVCCFVEEEEKLAGMKGNRNGG